MLLHLRYEAASALMARTRKWWRLRAWGVSAAERCGIMHRIWEYESLETHSFIRRQNVVRLRRNPFFPVNTRQCSIILICGKLQRRWTIRG
jgi:hypothetical protein